MREWGRIVLKSIISILFVLWQVSLFAQDEEFKPSGKLNAQVFADYYYVASADTAVSSKTTPLKNTVLKKEKDYNAFMLRRMYLGYEYKFSPKISTMIRLEADEGSVTNSGKTDVFLKDASLKWAICEGQNLIVGLQPTFAFEMAEKNWGHRYIEKTHFDLRGVVASRDVGITLQGKLIDAGKISYAIMLGNNSANKPESDKYKRFYANISAKPLENFEVMLYADYAGKSKVNDKSVNEFVSGIYLGYKNKSFSLGAEGFTKSKQNSFVSGTDLKSLKSLGISTYGTVFISDKTAAFARFDIFNPNTDSKAKGDSRNFIAAGFDYKPISNVTVSPNVLIETYEKYTTAVGDYSPKASIWPRLTFYWNFK